VRTWKPSPAHAWRVVHVHYDEVDGGLYYRMYVLVTMLDRVIEELSQVSVALGRNVSP